MIDKWFIQIPKDGGYPREATVLSCNFLSQSRIPSDATPPAVTLRVCIGQINGFIADARLDCHWHVQNLSAAVR